MSVTRPVAYSLSTLALLLSLSAPRCFGQTPAASGIVAIRAGRVLDPASGTTATNQIILVRDGRVTAVGPSVPIPSGATVIDLTRYTVLPGLIDAHVHLVIGGSPLDNAMADLRAGFTTLVDLGARTDVVVRLRDSIESGGAAAPRVLAAGLWVGKRGGVCEFNGIGIDSSVTAFRDRVGQNIRSGSNVAKLCVSGWPAGAYARPAMYEIGEEILRGAITEAHAARQVVVAHAISAGSVEASLRAGIDGFAHTPLIDDSTVAKLRTRGAFVISTLASLSGNDTSAVSRALIASTQRVHRAGVPLVFGTDGGVLPHGRNAEEFRALERAGVPPLEMLRAATVNAARAFRLADSIGTIAVGKSADIIALEGDPFTDAAAYERVKFVMARGRIVK